MEGEKAPTRRDQGGQPGLRPGAGWCTWTEASSSESVFRTVLARSRICPSLIEQMLGWWCSRPAPTRVTGASIKPCMFGGRLAHWQTAGAGRGTLFMMF